MSTVEQPLNQEEQEAVDAQEAEARRLELLVEVDDLKWLMGEKQGRRIVWRLLSEAGVYRSSFSVDAAVMAFREGERNRGLKLLTEITEHCPDQLNRMTLESQAYAKRNRTRRARN